MGFCCVFEPQKATFITFVRLNYLWSEVIVVQIDTHMHNSGMVLVTSG